MLVKIKQERNEMCNNKELMCRDNVSGAAWTRVKRIYTMCNEKEKRVISSS